MLYSSNDYIRVSKLNSQQNNNYRSDFRRDYSRLLHSPSFRRLKGKTQLFPGSESDFFRNRLTHSLEVAQIAKSIALKLNQDALKSHPKFKLDLDLIEFAGLAHDLGHPPFGHLGEKALDEEMRRYGGFEGNAQTLRIISKLEKKGSANKPLKTFSSKGEDKRIGLNLTYRSIASILKYDFEIPENESERIKAENSGAIKKDNPVKGYYCSEKELVNDIKKKLVGTNSRFKTIECSIMDLADDIAYSTYDLEDSFKAGFVTPLHLVLDNLGVHDDIAKELSNDFNKNYNKLDVRKILYDCFKPVFESVTLSKKLELSPAEFEAAVLLSMDTVFSISNKIAKDGYFRSSFTSELINKYVNAIDLDKVDYKNPCLSTIKIDKGLHEELSALKYFTYYSQVHSSKLGIVEYRGKQIVKEIFGILSTDNNFKIMPNDFKDLFKECSSDYEKNRCICDFIAGMTDKYAIEFYGRLKSEKPESIFKPF